MTDLLLEKLTPAQLLSAGIEKVESLSARLGIYAVASFAIILLWFAFLGFAGLQLIRLFSAVCASGVGFYAGCVGFMFLKTKTATVGMIPDFFAYVVGLLCMLLLFYLAWRLCEPFVFMLLGVGGGLMAYMLIGNWIAAAAIGIVLMIAAFYCFASVVIVATGCTAGVASYILLGLIFPNVAVLQSIGSVKGILITLGISAFFVLVQWNTTPNYRKFGI